MEKEITSIFESSALEFMREAIIFSSGNEVYFGINFNSYSRLEHIEVIARGNKDSVPAIISLSLEFDAVVHNHPSGELTPSRPDLSIASELGNNAGVGFYIINNNASEYYEVVRPIRAEKTVQLDSADTLYMFAESGLLSKTLSRYEYRQEQTDLVESIVDSFNNNTHLMAEAGTGIGKSLAYIVPSLLWLKNNKTRIVISTNTINLQQQIILKDIPAVIASVAPGVKYALVKGRYNYVCIKKIKEILKDGDALFDTHEQMAFFEDIDKWIETTKDGSITDLGYKPSGDLWEMVACDNDTCTHRKCDYLEDCFFYRMRKTLNAAQLLIVNHHILCADLSLHAETSGRYALLPRYTKIIIDEAHNFENSASSYFGDEGSKTGITKALYYISNQVKGKNRKFGSIENIRVMLEENKMSITPEEYDTLLKLISESHTLAARLRNTSDESSKLFSSYCHEHIEHKDGLSHKFRISATLASSEHWQTKGIKPLRDILNSLTNMINHADKLYKMFFDLMRDKGVDTEDIEQMSLAYLERLRRQLNSLNSVINFKKDEYIRWIELKITKKGHLLLAWHLTPVEVGKNLHDYLYRRFDTVAMFSATLTVGKTFDFFSKRLGFNLIDKNRAGFIYLESPFNYKDNARLYITTDSPDTTSVMFNKFTADTLTKVCKITGGRTFMLFTSFSALMSVFGSVQEELKKLNINSLAQTAGMHRHTLLDMFKSSENNVLFGVDSFWEGVDVAGKNLEVVIIPKLPFAVPTDPISEGRYEYIEEMGGNAFMDYALPFAVIKFKQGFGRLIRGKEDRGVVFVLDKRLTSKRYGEKFINSLPKAKIVNAKSEIIFDDMKIFFD